MLLMLLYNLTAMQHRSGVTPLAYHFEKPMIVTNVGGLPALVPDNKAGLVVSPDAISIANGILQFYKTGENHFAPFIQEEKKSCRGHLS